MGRRLVDDEQKPEREAPATSPVRHGARRHASPSRGERNGHGYGRDWDRRGPLNGTRSDRIHDDRAHSRHRDWTTYGTVRPDAREYGSRRPPHAATLEQRWRAAERGPGLGRGRGSGFGSRGWQRDGGGGGKWGHDKFEELKAVDDEAKGKDDAKIAETPPA